MPRARRSLVFIIGLGIVRLTSFMVKDVLADSRLVALLEQDNVSEPVPITALMPPGRQHLPRVRALIDMLAEPNAETPFGTA